MGNKLIKHIEKSEPKTEDPAKIPIWYWQSNKNCWSSNEKPTWDQYEDIDVEIIEEAYKASETDSVDLGDYWIDLKQFVQVSQRDKTKQREVKRVLRTREELLRENNRFNDPLSAAGPFNDVSSEGGYHGFIKSWRSRNEHLSDDELLELAASGILFEAAKGNYPFQQADWIAKQLRTVKGKGKREISIKCLHLYTLESFLYRLINGILRDNDQSKVDTLGPFCYLLFQTRYDSSLNEHQYWGTVYRGIQLDDAMLEKCRQSIGEWKCWYQFSSTSKDRSIAEKFGNTLFIVDVKLKLGGLSIKDYSNYANENEVLLPAGVQIRVDKVDIDETTNKNLVYVTAQTRDPACLALNST